MDEHLLLKTLLPNILFIEKKQANKKTYVHIYVVRAELERKAEGLVVKVTARAGPEVSPHGSAKASALATWYSLVCPKSLSDTQVCCANIGPSFSDAFFTRILSSVSEM